MKNVLKIIIIAIYLFSSTGFILVKHYCSGEVQSVKIVHAPSEKDICNCESSCCESSCCDIPDDCCSNETEVLKVDDVHTAKENFELKISFAVEFLSSETINSPEFSEKRFSTSLIDFSSPPKNSRNILFSVFLI